MDSSVVIEDAIKRFYLTGQNDVHQWLLQFQNTNEAWQYVWLLLNPAKPHEVQFFAASTLYTKISKQWFHLPESEQEYIRNQLITTVKDRNLHKGILNSLCQSVSALLAHLNSVDRIDSTNCIIDDLVHIFPYNEPISLHYLLKTLIHIPNELKKKFGQEKTKLHNSLLNSWPKIIWLLIQMFSSCNGPVKDDQNNSLYILGLECLSHWLSSSHFPIDVTEQIYPHLLESCIRYLPSKQEESECSRGFDAAEECLTRILVNHELIRHPTLVWKLAKGLVSLINEESARYYYQLLTEFGDTHSRTLLLGLLDDTKIEQKAIVEKIIEYALKCSDEKGRYPTDERYSILPFSFWYSLQDDVESLDKPQDTQALQALKPIYARLSMILMRKSELPLRAEDAGNAEERELFRCYRQDIADCYAYCHNVLGNDFLLLIGQRLSSPPMGENHWVFVESSIFAFKGISESASSIGSNYIEALLDLILKIQYDNYPDEVLSSACSAIGSLSDWLGVHSNVCMERCLQLVGTGLSKSSITTPSASMALVDIVRECGPNLAPIAPSILDTVNRSFHMLNPANTNEGSRLMYTAGLLIGVLKDHNLQLHYLEQILGYCILKLKEMIEEPRSDIYLKYQFKMVGMFVSRLSGPIVKTVFDAVMPVFEQSICNSNVMEKPAVVEDMMESLHQFATSIISSEQESESLAKVLQIAYKKHPHPKAFKVLSVLLIMHSKTKNVIIEQVFTEMCALTLNGANVCIATGGSLSELCDILEDFFRMLSQQIRKNPEFLPKMQGQFTQMIQLAIMSLCLPEAYTTTTASSFLYHILLHDYVIPDTLGQQLVCMVVQCIAEKVILNNLKPHADIIHALNKKMPQMTVQWMRNAIHGPTGPNVSNDEKDIFLRTVLRHNSKSRLFEIIKVFGLICRQTKIGLVHR